MREPDWEALNQLQFLLIRRMVEPLNAALSAMSLLDLDSADDKPREYWRQRATEQTLGVLNLVNAWHALIRYKLGELLPEQHFQPFYAQDLLDWLSHQLQLIPALKADDNLLLEANRETLQEALLLLYSAVHTLGPSVHLITSSTGNGLWFRVRYARHAKTAPCPTDLEALLQRLGSSWRSEDTAFELRTAADFIALNSSELRLQGTKATCELVFFIYAVGQRPKKRAQTANTVTALPPVSSVEELAETFAAQNLTPTKPGSSVTDTPTMPETLAEEPLEGAEAAKPPSTDTQPLPEFIAEQISEDGSATPIVRHKKNNP